MTMRELVKSTAEAALVRTGVVRAVRRRLRGRGVVLAYHNIVPTGESRAGELAVHLPQADFARQLDLIAATHDVVPLDSILDDVGHSARPRVAITFDDAYHGAITAGLAELQRRSMPATVFVAPGLLGRDTWWDRLAGAAGGVMSDDVRRHAIENLRGDRDAVLARFETHEQSRNSPLVPRIASEADLVTAARQQGITFGSHTWSHRNLSALSSDELEAELAPSLAWLRVRFTNVVPWLSYPYGMSSDAAEHIAERSRYRGAFRVSGGWLHRDSARAYALPRLGIPAGLSVHGLALRLAGIAATR
jgi:peptidoglycan/xylan/chitin deacetylase (PgdA/CDA1 family)